MTHFRFDEQVASEPSAVREVLERTEVPELDPGRPIVFTGIGTSLHACRIAAAWVAQLTGGRVRPVALEAHRLGLSGPLRPDDQIVVVSHRGTKTYPNRVLMRAKSVGARTVLVTGYGAEHPFGDRVLRTCRDETASTHTVSYVTALAVLGLLVAPLAENGGREFTSDLFRVPEQMERTLALPIPAEVVGDLASRSHLLLTGFGLDEVTAEEAALKLKEGAYLWAEGMSEEFALHGTPAVFQKGMAAVLIVPDEDDGGRCPALRGLLEEIGVKVVSCGIKEGSDLRFVGGSLLTRPLVSILPLQRLVGELARLRGTNPDTTRSDVEPWASAIGRVKL